MPPSLLFRRLSRHSSQPLLLCPVLQDLEHLGDPSQDFLKYAHVFLVLGSPELDTVLQQWFHKCY